MPDLHVETAILALILVIWALWETVFILRIKQSVRWVPIFLISVVIWGALRMSYWDILPAIFGMDQWANFADTFKGSTVNTILNLSMCLISIYAITARRRMKQDH